MKKNLFFVELIAVTILLSGCRSTPPAPAPLPPVLPTLLGDMQAASTQLTQEGRLAAVGIGESKSLELALNRAKVNGRLELSRLLELKLKQLELAFIEETGTKPDNFILSGFTATTRALQEQIAGRIAQTLRYETIGDTFTAYAIMVIEPDEIAAQLALHNELYARLKTTRAFAEFNAPASVSQ